MYCVLHYYYTALHCTALYCSDLTLTKLVDVTNIITDRGVPANNCICLFPSRLTRLNGDLALASIYLQTQTVRIRREDPALPCLHEVGVANMTGEIYLSPLLVFLLRLDTEVSRLIFLLPCRKITKYPG